MRSDPSRAGNAAWGEVAIGLLALPGAVAAITLALPFGLGEEQIRAIPGPLAKAAAWLAMMSPLLSLIGGATLILGTLVASSLPGRPRVKWIILAVGIVLWAAAFYSLSVPGLIELP